MYCRYLIINQSIAQVLSGSKIKISQKQCQYYVWAFKKITFTNGMIYVGTVHAILFIINVMLKIRCKIHYFMLIGKKLQT